MRVHATALFAASLSLCALAAPASADSQATRAETLQRDAVRRLAIGTREQRQFARAELEDAARLAPEDDSIALVLGRLYLDSEMLSRARTIATGVAARSPGDAAAQFLLGEVWRREWLVDVEDDARDRAIACLARGLQIAPRDFHAAQMLVPLLIEVGEDSTALAVAQMAARAAPRDPQAWLLVACAAQYAGDVALADRMFARAIPALPAATRERFEDLSPLFSYSAALAYAGLSPEARAARNERFWRLSDPDPVSSENEARLEFCARLTHALLLYGVDEMGDLDERGKLMVRFGTPKYRDRNSLLNPQSTQQGTWLSWTYPELGMRAWLNSANPLAHYRAKYGTFVHAFPDSLARRPDLKGVQGGWAVFRALPEGVTPLDARWLVARFEGADSQRMLAQVETSTDPAARVVTEWVVLDSVSSALARSTTDMRRSACGPAEVRTAAFDAPLAPGRYRLGVRVDDGADHRAVLTRDFTIAPQGATLALSDLVLVCGRPESSILPGAGLRLEPDTGLLPQSGDQLYAYCEIYHLRPDHEGGSTYEYVCTVSPEETDRRSWLTRLIAPHPAAPPIQMTRRETTRGDLRRQFFSIPVQALPPGRYQLEVRVRDLATGAESSSLASFERR